MPSTPLWPLVVYFALLLVVVGAMLFLGHYLGERHRERATGMPYESGMRPTGSARLLFPVEFYLIAMFFVIFDLETVFVVAWAVSARSLGWAGYFSIV
ncbi:MAG TPA: NADH-quinone oxidoreductase subunit A, partial [Armatimonadota bacterium]